MRNFKSVILEYSHSYLTPELPILLPVRWGFLHLQIPFCDSFHYSCFIHDPLGFLSTCLDLISHICSAVLASSLSHWCPQSFPLICIAVHIVQTIPFLLMIFNTQWFPTSCLSHRQLSWESNLCIQLEVFPSSFPSSHSLIIKKIILLMVILGFELCAS